MGTCFKNAPSIFDLKQSFAGFEDLLYVPKSAVTDSIRCDAFHMRR